MGVGQVKAPVRVVVVHTTYMFFDTLRRYLARYICSAQPHRKLWGHCRRTRLQHRRKHSGEAVHQRPFLLQAQQRHTEHLAEGKCKESKKCQKCSRSMHVNLRAQIHLCLCSSQESDAFWFSTYKEHFLSHFHFQLLSANYVPKDQIMPCTIL